MRDSEKRRDSRSAARVVPLSEMPPESRFWRDYVNTQLQPCEMIGGPFDGTRFFMEPSRRRIVWRNLQADETGGPAFSIYERDGETDKFRYVGAE